jgi:muramoyltetrapeptide carboxypeptidase
VISSIAVRPPAVPAGATVALCAPALPVKPERLARGLALLRERFDVRIDDGMFASAGFLAGSDERRADELNRWLRDPDVRAIVMARGGYGLMRILDRLDADALRRDPKLIVGFSDGTALLSWAQRAGVLGIHGPVCQQLGDLPAADVAWLFELMARPAPAGMLEWPLAAIGMARDEGVVLGRLCGGNLTMLTHLIGTPWQVELAGGVVILEEVGERPYAVDRYFTHLQLAGVWDGVQAALVGDFARCGEKPDTEDEQALAVVGERLARAYVPELQGAPIGHGKRNAALPYGARCALDFTKGRLHLLDAAVEPP